MVLITTRQRKPWSQFLKGGEWSTRKARVHACTFVCRPLDLDTTQSHILREGDVYQELLP